MKPIRIPHTVFGAVKIRSRRWRALVATAWGVVLIFSAHCASHAQAPKIADAPKGIQELSAYMQGKQPEEVRTAILNHLGPAQRNIGSGLRIEEWDTPEGVLTFHPGNGPTFLETKTKRLFRLLPTTNPVRANLLAGYEMTTLADPANHGNCYWLGNLGFGPDGTYRFTDSGQNQDHRGGQKENFFMLHPMGKVEVRYHAAITGDTVLETLADGTPVADLTFIPADAKVRATFSIITSERERRLEFTASRPISFRMDTGWKSFWR